MNQEAEAVVTPPATTRSARPAMSRSALPGLLVVLTMLAGITAIGLLGVDWLVADAVTTREPATIRLAADVIGKIGGIGIYPLTALVVLFWAWWHRPNLWLWRTCLWILTAEGLCAAVVRVLKMFFGRWRPDQAPQVAGYFDYFKLHSCCHSFPSGHTSDVVAVATVLWFAYPRLRLLWLAGVLVMAASRIGAMKHFVADTAAGAILGILCALWIQRGQATIEGWIEKHYALIPEDAPPSITPPPCC